jgi:myo-inositol-1(or 4)-monophosphatase
VASDERRDASARGQPAATDASHAARAVEPQSSEQYGSESADATLLRAAVEAAYAAAQIISAKAADIATLAWEEKSPSDFVSDVDRASEEVIRATLAKLAPIARLIGEETSSDVSGAREGTVFVADPLDGTTNFLHGFPAYAVSIAALVDGELRAGVVLDVTRDELFTATLGTGAQLNGAPIAVSKLVEPSRALIGTGFPFKHRDLIVPYIRQLPGVMASTAGIRRAGSAALDLAAVACGRFDAFWELMLAPWDMAAGMLLVREAGGVVTDLDGAPSRVAHGALVCGNPAMHRWLLDRITNPTQLDIDS